MCVGGGGGWVQISEMDQKVGRSIKKDKEKSRDGTRDLQTNR